MPQYSKWNNTIKDQKFIDKSFIKKANKFSVGYEIQVVEIYARNWTVFSCLLFQQNLIFGRKKICNWI